MQRDRTSKYSRSVRGFLPGRQRLRSSFANEHSQGARWLILSSGHGSPSPPNAGAQRLVRRSYSVERLSAEASERSESRIGFDGVELPLTWNALQRVPASRLKPQP